MSAERTTSGYVNGIIYLGHDDTTQVEHFNNNLNKFDVNHNNNHNYNIKSKTESKNCKILKKAKAKIANNFKKNKKTGTGIASDVAVEAVTVVGGKNNVLQQTNDDNHFGDVVLLDIDGGDTNTDDDDDDDKEKNFKNDNDNDDDVEEDHERGCEMLERAQQDEDENVFNGGIGIADEMNESDSVASMETLSDNVSIWIDGEKHWISGVDANTTCSDLILALLNYQDEQHHQQHQQQMLLNTNTNTNKQNVYNNDNNNNNNNYNKSNNGSTTSSTSTTMTLTSMLSSTGNTIIATPSAINNVNLSPTNNINNNLNEIGDGSFATNNNTNNKMNNTNNTGNNTINQSMRNTKESTGNTNTSTNIKSNNVANINTNNKSINELLSEYAIVKQHRHCEEYLDGSTKVFDILPSRDMPDRKECELLLRRLAIATPHMNTQVASLLSTDKDSGMGSPVGSSRSAKFRRKKYKSSCSSTNWLAQSNTLHPKVSQRFNNANERLMKIILAQDETIHQQLSLLREKERQILKIEEEKHRVRERELGKNYLLETYLNGLDEADIERDYEDGIEIFIDEPYHFVPSTKSAAIVEGDGDTIITKPTLTGTALGTSFNTRKRKENKQYKDLSEPIQHDLISSIPTTITLDMKKEKGYETNANKTRVEAEESNCIGEGTENIRTSSVLHYNNDVTVLTHGSIATSTTRTKAATTTTEAVAVAVPTVIDNNINDNNEKEIELQHQQQQEQNHVNHSHNRHHNENQNHHHQYHQNQQYHQFQHPQYQHQNQLHLHFQQDQEQAQEQAQDQELLKQIYWLEKVYVINKRLQREEEHLLKLHAKIRKHQVKRAYQTKHEVMQQIDKLDNELAQQCDDIRLTEDNLHILNEQLKHKLSILENLSQELLSEVKSSSSPFSSSLSSQATIFPTITKTSDVISSVEMTTTTTTMTSSSSSSSSTSSMIVATSVINGKTSKLLEADLKLSLAKETLQKQVNFPSTQILKTNTTTLLQQPATATATPTVTSTVTATATATTITTLSSSSTSATTIAKVSHVLDKVSKIVAKKNLKQPDTVHHDEPKQILDQENIHYALREEEPQNLQQKPKPPEFQNQLQPHLLQHHYHHHHRHQQHHHHPYQQLQQNLNLSNQHNFRSNKKLINDANELDLKNSEVMAVHPTPLPLKPILTESISNQNSAETLKRNPTTSENFNKKKIVTFLEHQVPQEVNVSSKKSLIKKMETLKTETMKLKPESPSFNFSPIIGHCLPMPIPSHSQNMATKPKDLLLAHKTKEQIPNSLPNLDAHLNKLSNHLETAAVPTKYQRLLKSPLQENFLPHQENQTLLQAFSSEQKRNLEFLEGSSSKSSREFPLSEDKQQSSNPILPNRQGILKTPAIPILNGPTIVLESHNLSKSFPDNSYLQGNFSKNSVSFSEELNDSPLLVQDLNLDHRVSQQCLDKEMSKSLQDRYLTNSLRATTMSPVIFQSHCQRVNLENPNTQYQNCANFPIHSDEGNFKGKLVNPNRDSDLRPLETDLIAPVVVENKSQLQSLNPKNLQSNLFGLCVQNDMIVSPSSNSPHPLSHLPFEMSSKPISSAQLAHNHNQNAGKSVNNCTTNDDQLTTDQTHFLPSKHPSVQFTASTPISSSSLEHNHMDFTCLGTLV